LKGQEAEMSNEITTELGKIVIAEELLATLAGYAAIECYGLVGMSSRKLKDGISELLGRDNLSKGVQIKLDGDELVIDLYIIVSYGTRIPQVAQNVMEKVQYTLEHMTGLKVSQVNVNIQGVQVVNG
jgi:uncharacterized alkaline shock family protein YloU